MDFRILIAYSLATVVAALSTNQKFGPNFWKSSTPGRLLNALDSMTFYDISSRTPTDAIAQPAFISSTTTPFPQRRDTSQTAQLQSQPTARKRIIISDDNSGASTSDEADDYERQYEQFVRNYFNDAADHYLSSDDESNESAETSNLSSDTSYETDTTAQFDAVPYGTSAKSTKNAGEKCRKVRRKREICVICKNLRSGERSETCSYEHASEPENYAYETQRKYRKSRDRENSQSDDDDDDEDEDDNTKAETSEKNVAQSQVNRKNIKPQQAKNTTELNASCRKRTINGKSCYYCKDAAGTQSVKCFNFSPHQKVGDRKKIPLKINNNTHQKRRIYKRTLSYVYQKGLDSNETINSPDNNYGNVTVSLE